MGVSNDHLRLIRFVAARTVAAEEQLYGADERARSPESITAQVRALELVLAACVRDTAEPVLGRGTTTEPAIRGRWERPTT